MGRIQLPPVNGNKDGDESNHKSKKTVPSLGERTKSDLGSGRQMVR